MMSTDDIFHDVIMAQERVERAGFEEGLARGKSQGVREGQKLGWEKGSAIGSEVGFYAGFAESLLEEMQKDPSSKPRVIKSLEKMLMIAENFPLSDPQNTDLQHKLEELRTKFKQVCSQLNIKPDTKTKPDVKGISF